jgi:hypothetical protein
MQHASFGNHKKRPFDSDLEFRPPTRMQHAAFGNNKKSALLIQIWNFSRQNVNAWDSLTSRLWEPQAPECSRCWPNPGNKLQDVLGFFQRRWIPPQRVRRIM